MDPQTTIGKENNTIYYGRIVDELIRYKRIQLFMLNPNSYLNMENREYNVLENESLLLQSMLTPEFYDEIKDIFDTNPFIYNIPYEMATPKKSQKYSNKISLEEQRLLSDVNIDQNEIEMHTNCIKDQQSIIGNTKTFWKNVFPKNCKEWIFTNKKICGYYMMIRIIREHLGKIETPTTIRNILYSSYRELIQNEKIYQNILHIFKMQGKKQWVKKMENGKMTFENGKMTFGNIIITDGYYLTELDIWILAEKLDLPIVLFANRVQGRYPLKTLGLDLEWINVGNRELHTQYFIRMPIISETSDNGVPSFHLIMPPVNINNMRIFENKYETQLKTGYKTVAEYLHNHIILSKP
jgi:hypothetical protein